MNLNKKIAQIKQKYFLRGREYERLVQERNFNKKHIIEACQMILDKFPEYQKPDDGNGDEYNAGYNKAIDELAEIIIDSFGETLIT